MCPSTYPQRNMSRQKKLSHLWLSRHLHLKLCPSECSLVLHRTSGSRVQAALCCQLHDEESEAAAVSACKHCRAQHANTRHECRVFACCVEYRPFPMRIGKQVRCPTTFSDPKLSRPGRSALNDSGYLTRGVEGGRLHVHVGRDRSALALLPDAPIIFNHE